jgi:hypothetical protein
VTDFFGAPGAVADDESAWKASTGAGGGGIAVVEATPKPVADTGVGTGIG